MTHEVAWRTQRNFLRMARRIG